MMATRMWILAAVLSLAPALGSANVNRSFPEQGKRLPRSFSIVIDKTDFGVTPLGIRMGDTIEWVNNDIFDHTATSKAGGWDVVIPAGKKACVVMKKAGVFDYLCKYHPNMTGTVRVSK